MYVYASELFLIDHHCKTKSKLTDMPKNRPNLLNFLHCVIDQFWKFYSLYPTL